MPIFSELSKEHIVSVPSREKQEEEIKNEKVGSVSDKDKKEIIKFTVKCLAGITGVTAIGVVTAGESGQLPTDIKGWDAQETYNQISESARVFFGIEEANEELTSLVKEQKSEFSEELIKNRLSFSSNSLVEKEKQVSFWYLGELSPENDNSLVSAVVAGEPSVREIEAVNKNRPNKEIIIPVAFQHPTTGEFIIRELSLSDFSILGHMTVAELENSQLTNKETGLVSKDELYYKDSNYLQYDTSGMQLLEKIKVGNQIAFALTTTMERFFGYLPEKEIKDIPEEVRNNSYFRKMEKEAVTNNKAIVKAMKENEDLPNVTIYSSQFFVSK